MSSRRAHLWTGFVILTLLVWLFGSAIFGRQSFVFRDAAHYYAPLFEWNAAEWRDGRVPLWNPLEFLGLPALGENTGSVFYPGQLLLFAPIDILWAYNIYIVAHVGIGAWGAWRLARRFGCEPAAAGQGALAYAFSGAVVFQYCNIVFLVGAAWLPLALEAIDRLLESPGIRRATRLAACLAMMVLGGDPQMAYHVGLAGLLYAAISARYGSLGDDESAVSRPASGRRAPFSKSSFARHGAWLAGAGLTAAGLAAVQIAPGWELASRSPRAADDGPRNIWELAAGAFQSPAALPDEEGPPRRSLLLDARAGDSHMRHVYQFSIGPWRWLELAWPNVDGRQFPIHKRWLSALEGDRRIWSPSLYAGALALPLAFGAWRQARGPRWRWIKWLAAWSALASLGEFGLGWGIGEATQFAAGRSLAVGPEMGGVYWLMNVLLPGYVAFRYPAKLWTIAALAIAMLSARGWQDAASGEDAIAPSRLKWLGIAGIAGAVVALVARPWLLDQFGAAPPDVLFGPLDTRGAWADLAMGFGQGAIVCLIGWRLLRPGGSQMRWTPAAMLALTAIDLGIAHRWLVPCADMADWRIRAAFAPPPAGGPEGTRIYRDLHWLPKAWRETGSPDRLLDMLAWDRNTLLPKYHLSLGLGSVESSGMMMPDDYAAFWDIARRHGPERPDGVNLPDRSVLDLAGAEYLVLPAGSRYAATRLLSPPATAPGADADQTSPANADRTSPADAALWKNERACPRAWIVHDVEQLAPLDDRRPAAIRARTERVLFHEGKPRDWHREAVIETATPIQLFGDAQQGSGEHSAESCRVLSASSQRVTLAARLARPGLIVLGDSYYPGWRATLISADGVRQEAEIVRANRVLRGVAARAGEFRVEFSYEPRSFWIGIVVSGLGWSAYAAVMAWPLVPRLRS